MPADISLGSLHLLSIFQVLATLKNLIDTEAFQKGDPSPLVGPGQAEEIEAERCNHAKVEIFTQWSASTHQGMVLSGCRLESSEGTDI